MELPSYLDLAQLLLALPYPGAEPTNQSVLAHEDFSLALLAPGPSGLPTKSLGYLLLVHLAHESMRQKTRNLGSSLTGLCKALGAHELASDAGLVEDQLRRVSQTLVQVEIAGGKKARTLAFPLFSCFVLETGGREKQRRWRCRLSGDFQRVIKHTAPALIPKASRLTLPT